MARRFPAHVYYARWSRQQERLINDKGYWTAELEPIDQRWWAWMRRQTFPPAL
jgi:hypothetical protein